MTGMSMSSQSGSCFDDPSQMSCMNYVYPTANISNDIKMLCMSMSSHGMGMPTMAGCSVSRQCLASKASGPYCNGMSLLNDMCFVEGMSAMMGCSHYAKLCQAGTMVMQCTNNPSIPHFISGANAKQSVLDMCSSMPMDPCEDCTTSKCSDPLMTLGKLCQSMEGMSQCKDWEEMCQDIGNGMGMYCGGGDGPIIPMMRMYFHTGINDIFLFRSWVPRNHLDYAAIWFFFFFLAIFQIFLKAVRSMKERKWQQLDQSRGKVLEKPLLKDKSSKSKKIPFSTNTRRALFVFVTGTFDYCLMFAAMTFNIGIFFAVVLGFSFGTLFFGHKIKDGEAFATCCF